MNKPLEPQADGRFVCPCTAYLGRITQMGAVNELVLAEPLVPLRRPRSFEGRLAYLQRSLQGLTHYGLPQGFLEGLLDACGVLGEEPILLLGELRLDNFHGA